MNNKQVITLGVAAIAGFVAYKLATDPDARRELTDLGEKLKDGVHKVADLVDQARDAIGQAVQS